METDTRDRAAAVRAKRSALESALADVGVRLGIDGGMTIGRARGILAIVDRKGENLATQQFTVPVILALEEFRDRIAALTSVTLNPSPHAADCIAWAHECMGWTHVDSFHKFIGAMIRWQLRPLSKPLIAKHIRSSGAGTAANGPLHEVAYEVFLHELQTFNPNRESLESFLPCVQERMDRAMAYHLPRIIKELNGVPYESAAYRKAA